MIEPVETPDDDVVARVLASADSKAAGYSLFRSGSAQALDAEPRSDEHDDGHDGAQLDREDRNALRRVPSLSTELEDVTEVEYRQLRLENVILIGLYTQGTVADAENSMRELAALAETAGATVLDGLMQRRATPDTSTYLGKGKAQELAGIVKALGADTVIADTELAPSQRRALEDVVKVKVIDRTATILDIFSQHAKSREGKAQVELAQLEYLLPRLRGWGDSMSRQAGGQVGGTGAGMGSRGPGETKIELDRRRIHTRMSRLRKQILAMKPAREAKRANRKRNAVPSVAIVGYTNAGKSSLLNRITRAGVLVENSLFATLDATVRKSTTSDGRLYTLTDTVGFVRNLPHQLVEAFRSTLEEVADADVIVHVVDASHPDPASQLATVREVIGEVGAREIPELVVFNKSDLVTDDDRLVLRGLWPKGIFVSTRTGEGVDEVLAAIAGLLPRPSIELDLLIPYERGDLIAMLHAQGTVLTTDYAETGTRVRALVTTEIQSQFAPFAVAPAAAVPAVAS
ncbi:MULTISPECIES: GTPase HflX [unclassified Cryobacterium]|uniref:GTPase HflX n=1 Tax=unclassified Cryobacterium TaxID=2649013 RepID=UPI00106A0603|nr:MULTISPECIES: GTPase HflX [unclassified Cryobacterium]MDY7527185.1 GTPase HflX [Cryobacterium sp. 10C2]MDY7557026.1 GTPase HflX [Cryobacterium sp. 10C3]MEB0002082.1 GTPase HflX [Cryobacterium sp. RTC2.1]MEB0200319.1 GTPase HflX [Cryobacterium sp. 5I3]MEB0290795.1 GTPase HflX [Cryobacterium sp. 10C2]